MHRLIFSGVLVEGAEQAEVEQNLARLLKLDVAAVQAKLFKGRPVTLKRVASEAEARKWQQAFAKAGATLNIASEAEAVAESSSDQSSESALATEPVAPQHSSAVDTNNPDASTSEADTSESAPKGNTEPRVKSRKRLYIGLGIAAQLLIGAVLVALWFTRPLWQHSELSAGDQALGTAMVTDDSFAIARLDVQRLNALEGLSGEPVNLNTLPVGDGLLDSLAHAGLNVRADIDMLWLAGYLSNDKPSSLLLASGRFKPAELHAWFEERYEIEQSLGDGVVFRLVDEENCEKGEAIRAFLSENLVLVGELEQVGLVLERIAAKTPISERVARWFSVSESQVASAAVFAPENIGKSASGLVGMMLGGMGRAAEPAEGLYFGLAPVVLPPGVELTLLMESSDTAFLDSAKGSFDERVEVMRENAANNYPETLKLYDRLSVERTDGGLQAAIRFDKNLRTEISQWVSSMFTGSISSNGDGQGQVEERIDENPPVYGKVAAQSLDLFDITTAQADAFFKASTSAGPFVLGVQALEINADNQLMIKLESRAYDLPNLPSRGAAATMVLIDVTDDQGKSLLPEVACGSDASREPVDIGQAISYSNYVDGEMVQGVRVSGEASYTLRPYVAVSDVYEVRGYIEYPLTLDVETITLQQPLAGQTIERDGFSMRFTQAGSNAISYHYQAEPGKLLHVQPLNSAGQPLQTGGAMWGGAFFGTGQTAKVDVQGEVAAVQVVIAREVRKERYEFFVNQITPDIGESSSFSFGREPIEWTPASWQGVPTGDAPAVTYAWNKPILEEAVGPMHLAVYDASASKHFGTRFTSELFLDFNIEITSLLNAGTVVIDSMLDASGELVEADMRSPLAFALDGGMWMNGVYEKDEEKNWVKASVDMRDRELKLESLREVSGYVSLNLPLESSQHRVPFRLGESWQGDGVTLTLSKLEGGAAYLNYRGDLSSVLAIVGVKAGEPVTQAAEFYTLFGESSIKLPLSAMPDELVLTLATQTEEQRYPFRLSVPEQ